VARVKAIYETTNDQRLTPISLDTYRSALPDAAAVTGTPYNFVDLGFLGVAKQPSDASSIFVDSTSASDTNTAYLEGYRTGGYFTSLSVTMTGITAVSLKGTAVITDIIEITKFYLSAAAVGTVTLHEDASGGTELARIPIGQTHARYRKVALWPTPATAVTYQVDYERDLPDMAIAKDEPVLPPRFHRLLATGARMKEFDKKDDSRRYELARRDFEQGLADLLYFVNSSVRPVLGRRVVSRPSQLGGYFPAGS